MDIECDVPKYKKKKNYKGLKRSKHKHIYERGLLVGVKGSDIERFASVIEYCNICGKVGKHQLFDGEHVLGSKFVRTLSYDEILEKHKNLNIFKTDDLFVKYVAVSSCED